MILERPQRLPSNATDTLRQASAPGMGEAMGRRDVQPSTSISDARKTTRDCRQAGGRRVSIAPMLRVALVAAALLAVFCASAQAQSPPVRLAAPSDWKTCVEVEPDTIFPRERCEAVESVG